MTAMRRVLRGVWRVLRAVLLTLLAAVIFVEEWGWRPLTAWAGRLAQWPPLARLEAYLRTVSPWTALALFAVPAVSLFPIKLLALAAMQRGHVVLGLAVIVGAKLLGTALVGRLFLVVEPQLMRIGWVARLLTWWRQTRQRVVHQLRASVAWRTARAVVRGWRRFLRRWMRTDAS